VTLSSGVLSGMTTWKVTVASGDLESGSTGGSTGVFWPENPPAQPAAKPATTISEMNVKTGLDGRCEILMLIELPL